MIAVFAERLKPNVPRGKIPLRMDFTVAFDPADSARVSRFVVGRFFTPRELPQALGRALFTRDFLLTAGIPLALCGAAYLLPEEHRVIAFAAVIAWLAVAAALLLAMGKSHAIGCTGAEGTLAGGLRLKVSKGKRRICLAGVVVEPDFRGKGIFTALLLAAFRLAARERERGPVTLTVFGPAHPASKHVVEKYFDGALALPVETEAGSTFSKSLAALEEEVRALAEKGVTHRFTLSDRGLF